MPAELKENELSTNKKSSHKIVNNSKNILTFDVDSSILILNNYVNAYIRNRNAYQWFDICKDLYLYRSGYAQKMCAEKGIIMRIESNVELTKQTDVKEIKTKLENSKENVQSESTGDSTVEVSISTQQKGILSDEELQCAIENVLASQSSILDVTQAAEMIAQANKNILAHANEAILAQANQTKPMVAELTQ